MNLIACFVSVETSHAACCLRGGRAKRKLAEPSQSANDRVSRDVRRAECAKKRGGESSMGKQHFVAAFLCFSFPTPATALEAHAARPPQSQQEKTLHQLLAEPWDMGALVSGIQKIIAFRSTPQVSVRFFCCRLNWRGGPPVL